jgi:hypothetical protein
MTIHELIALIKRLERLAKSEPTVTPSVAELERWFALPATALDDRP